MARRKSPRVRFAIIFILSCSFYFVSCKEGEKVTEQQIQVSSFSDLIEQVSNSEDSLEKVTLVDEFLQQNENAPIIDSDTSVYFIYYGEASRVNIAGDFNSWNPSNHSFSLLEGTQLWYRKEIFESNARLDYKLVISGSNWILDPRNSARILGGFGANSELAMPDYVQPTEILERDDVDGGTLIEHSVASENTGETYTTFVYLPFNYDSDKNYPTVYFQDGSDYLNIASAGTILDNLIFDEEIEPVIGVFVVPTERNSEYAFGERFNYRDFFVEELVPFVDSNYSTIQQSESRAVIGDSYGGNISAIISFSHPEVFGNCGIHSGAFQTNGFATNNIVMDGEKKEINVVSIWGSYEGASLPSNMHEVKDYLIENNYNVYWRELPEGHSWGLWRATLDEMLLFFFPKN